MAAIDAMMTGEALMLSALTVGVTADGSPRERMLSSIVDCVALMFGAEVELGDDQRDRVCRRGLQLRQARHALDGALDRLGHLAGHVTGADARV